MAARLFSFPDPVNEVSARLVAGGAALMALVTVALDQHWITVVIAYGFLARVLTGPTLSPLGQIVTRVITPRLNVPPRPVPGPPKRFAQAMGAVMSTLAAVLALGFGLETAADVILVMLVAAASLEAVFALCLGCKVFALLMRMGVIPQEVCERCNDLWGDRARAGARGAAPASGPARPRRWPIVALAAVGAALVLAPIALQMFGRAPKGAEMLSEFRPYMTQARLDGFQGHIQDIDDAVREGSSSVAAHLSAAAGTDDPRWFAARFPDFAAFRGEWAPIRSDMAGLMDTIEGNLGNYRAIAALPSFTLFPWFFIVPGALVLLLAAAAAVRRPWWAGVRWGLVVVGVALVAAPVAFQMFQRAPAGGRMMDTFRTIETRERVETIQGYFGSMAVGEGAIRLDLVPALRRSGLTAGEIERRFPAVSRLERRWVHILGDMTPMIGAMSDNVDNYAAVAALPSFALFPWFFVLPGLLTVGLVAAARPRRGLPSSAPSAAAVAGPSRSL
ncbi:MAG: hypothetical protein QOK40_1350 [Miltoncostaeaceae bacterium]|jgi:hypothetical protein|nr:hypothetical protein [Miltoncostaeaceae bacterium]